jgi:ABC-2 type transport system permease protein
VTYVAARPGPVLARVRGAGARGELRAVRVLWQREVLRFARNRLRVAMALVNPLLFLLILGTGLSSAVGSTGPGGADYRAYLFPGVLLMAVQMPAIGAGASIVWDRQAGFLREMLVAPVRRGSLVLGICLGGATTAALHGALVLSLAGFAGIAYEPVRLLVLLLELALIGLALTALGAFTAVRIKRMDTFQTVLGLATMPLLFLSGAMFPITGLPGWLRVPVLLNPLTYAVDALRRTVPGPDAPGPTWSGVQPPVWLELAFVAVLAAVVLMAAARRFARAE